LDGGINAYEYVGDDPANAADPSGLQPDQCRYVVNIEWWYDPRANTIEGFITDIMDEICNSIGSLKGRAGAPQQPDTKSSPTCPSGLVQPVSYTRISSPYNPVGREHPILDVTRPHWGTDFAAPEGTRVQSVAAGTVVYAANAGGGWGNQVVVNSPFINGTWTTRFAHLSSITVQVGQTVVGTQKVGEVGQTGLATGPHLHFALTGPDNKHVDPMRCLPQQEVP